MEPDDIRAAYGAVDAEAARQVVRELLARAEAAGGVPSSCAIPRTTGAGGSRGIRAGLSSNGDIMRALAGNGPVVIPKDGSEPFTLSSAEPTDVQIERLERTLREQDSHGGELFTLSVSDDLDAQVRVLTDRG